ncbi:MULTISPECIES: hypothetical protein [Pseudomonas]|uniref:hypothetical protein n=1 Tax=Pseudomonas TaxID=286 RepID=UPI000B34F3C1|nr:MULTISPECIES: hypothetical protein [Pseudomonas]PMY35936.1 hypothetical protein C1Y35_21800 [Pseudomonas sp. GW456-L14]PMY49521.1 hypothetical protein C1Y34_27960 [Pseudomonas sp. GW456-L12]PMY59508.1 hypothetical protein C1Y31_31580 [Pseudomonas sp. FW305-25]PMY60313.1 hypothetical protein C1Y32_31555 [Pseudomonas sp. FW126-L8]PNA69219.1 hypothetical protein C1Y33_31460 [Pseudomonas sp. FW305-76]
MNIDNHSVAGSGQASKQGAETSVPLDQRMGLQGAGANSSSDPEFAQFYDTLMKWVAGSATLPPGSVQQYLKQYANAGGELPYGTTQKQMDVLTQVMVRMKEQGLEGSAAYKEIKVALVSVSSVNMFVKEFMMGVFKPSEDEDDRANISW